MLVKIQLMGWWDAHNMSQKKKRGNQKKEDAIVVREKK